MMQRDERVRRRHLSYLLKGVGHFKHKFQGEGVLFTNEFWRLESLGYHVVLFV